MSRADIAFDARATSHMSVGMKQYTRELAVRLPRVAPDLRYEMFGGGDNFDAREQLGIPLQLARTKPRLAHFTSPYAPFWIPVPYVVTIHDLIDLRFPQFAKPKARWYYRNVVRRLARGARAVITDDERTAEDLAAFYGLARERIAIVPLGVDLEPCEPMRSDRPYVIYAGNRRPHKDLATLLRGWERVDPALELDLVLTGALEPGLLDHERTRGRVIFLGELDHAEVMRWIAGAQALVHPALAEGFGLPLLEAMRLGVPVVASDASVPLVLRDHARTFASGDAEGLAREVACAARGEAKERACEAQAATAALTWDRCALATAELYRNLLR